MICPSCGTEVPETSLFCSQCGNHLTRPRSSDQMPAESSKAIRFVNVGSILFGFGLIVALGGAVAPFLACVIGGASSIGCYSVTRFYATSLPLIVILGIAMFSLGLGMMLAAPRSLRKAAAGMGEQGA